MKTTSIPPALLLAILLPVSADAVSVVQFGADGSFEGHESSGTGGLSIVCTPAPTNRVTILLKATGGSADFTDILLVGRHTVDYANWLAGWPVDLVTGNAETQVGIPPVRDIASEPDETLHLTLSVLGGAAVIGTQSNAVLTIRNEHPSIGVEGRPTATEGAPVRCQFYRRGDTNVILSVGYATVDDTARAGVDYVAASGSVTFAAGQLEAEIEVATLDNGRVDGDRAFLLNFSTATPGIELQDPAAIATIVDNERPVAWDRTFAPRPVSGLATVARSSDGKLVVTEYPGPPVYAAQSARVVRWNADGTSDSDFTPAHIARPQDAPYVQHVVLDAAGRCYVAGLFETVNQRPRSGLARLLPDGALDESFRPPPGLVYPYGGLIYPNGGPVQLAVQPDGRILCLSYDGADGHRFVRLNADGSLDDSFHPDAVTRKARQVWAVAGNQALVDVSELENRVPEQRPLARLAADGSLDPSFHRAELTPRDESSVGIGHLVQQPDGKLLVAGWFASVDRQPRANLVRLNADGTVDAGFVPPPEAGWEYQPRIRSIAVDTQGRVLVAGHIGTVYGPSGVRGVFSSSRRLLLLRLKHDGSPDESFTPVSDEVFNQLSPGIFEGPFLGGEMLRVFPGADGNLLVWGTYFCWSGEPWINRCRSDFMARIYAEPPATSVELSAARLFAEPRAEQATVTVRRLGDTTKPATVDYATRDGSAVVGRDYVAASGSLTFAPLEVEKSFTVPLPDPALRRQDRELSVTLSDATGVAGISGPTAHVVLVAPFGFQGISGPPTDPRLTIFGSVGSTYLLESNTPPEHPSDPWSWRTAATAVTLTNEVQTIPDDPYWHDPWQDATTPVRFYRLRHLAP